MKNFFKKIGQTFCSSELYASARTQSFGSILWFLFKFLLMLSVVATIIIGLLYLSFFPKIKTMVVDYVNTSYPDDLVVTLNEKTLTTNKSEPVAFAVPPSLKTKTEGETRQNIMVLAPEEVTAEIGLLNKYDSYSVFTSKNVVMENGTGQYRTYDLNYKNNTFTKESVITLLGQVFKTVLPVLLALVLPGALIVLIFVAIKYLFSLLFISLLVLLIFKFQKIQMSYGEIYLMGMYSIVPVFLIDILLLPLNLGTGLINSLIILIVILYANRNLKSVIASTPVEAPNENS